MIAPGVVWSQCPTLNINLGSDTVICPDGALYLDAGEAVEYLWQDGSTDRYFTVTSAGVYFVSANNQCSADGDTILVGQAVLPEFTLKIPDREYFCKGEKVDVETEGLNPLTDFVFDWSVNSSTESRITVDTTSNISLSVRDIHGCERTKDIFVEFQYPYEMDKVLLATYDVANDRNMIIWSKTACKRTGMYSVYKGVAQNNLLNEVPYDQMNMMIDEETDPHVQSAFYDITLKDSCDNSSTFRLENGHKTILLTTELDSSGKAVLHWNKYQGFDYDCYYIYRGTTTDKLEIIDSVAETRLDSITFIDEKAVPDQLYFYQIAVKTPEPVYYDIQDRKKAKGGPYAHSLSNLEDNKLKTAVTTYMDPKISIYPNPFSETASIRYSIRKDAHVRIELLDMLGKRMALVLDREQGPGTYDAKVSASESGLVHGVYFIRINLAEAGIFTFKLIKN